MQNKAILSLIFWPHHAVCLVCVDWGNW